MHGIVAEDKKTNDDNDLFRQLMADVKPLPDKKSATQHIAEQKPRPAPKPRPPVADAPPSSGYIAREQVPEVAAEEHLFFARGGLQQRLLRRLKRGDLRPEARLDLHGRTIAEAGTLLSTFLADAQASGLRCVSVIHGKGHRSADGRPALKTQLNQWLRDTPAVLAFSSAQAKDGGMGALYVLLRRPS
jgi:DNA-nicking Smr family endonuclease